MKNIYLFGFSLMLFLSSIGLKASDVVVKGTVKFQNGTLAGNQQVMISVETVSGNMACSETHTVLTNNAGFYSDKLTCSSDIRKVKISIKNCEGQLVSQIKEVPDSHIIEANFATCTIPGCAAKFSATMQSPSSSGSPVKFNSNASEIGAGDAIVERIWVFGDKDSLKGNVVDPTHTYRSPGAYNVCLITRSSKGCSNTKCETIEVRSSCKADFSAEQAITGIKFNSKPSTTSTNDQITSRTWNFGDGSPEHAGNSIDPTHSYSNPGVYTVCLSIKTLGGCTSKECRQITVKPISSPCVARFSFENIAPKKFRFNGSSSSPSERDTIIERRWDFGDGTVISGKNEISPLKEFSKAGTYTVCLLIRTTKGCENKICLSVKVEEKVTNPGVNDAQIKILSIFPNPVHKEMNALIWSRNNNVNAEIAIFDIYGAKKWISKISLLQGNNVNKVPSDAFGNLPAGPYFFRVTTIYGVEKSQFYKL